MTPSVPTPAIDLGPALARALLDGRALEEERRRKAEACRIARAEEAAAAVLRTHAAGPRPWAGIATRMGSRLRRSGLLLPRWYAGAYGIRSPRLARRHYLDEGIANDLQPNPFFDPAWYRATHLAGRAEEAPIHHYLRIGAGNALQPGPLFDPVLYAALNPELAQEPDLLAHFLRRGLIEGRRFLPDPPC